MGDPQQWIPGMPKGQSPKHPNVSGADHPGHGAQSGCSSPQQHCGRRARDGSRERERMVEKGASFFLCRVAFSSVRL